MRTAMLGCSDENKRPPSDARHDAQISDRSPAQGGERRAIRRTVMDGDGLIDRIELNQYGALAHPGLVGLRLRAGT